MGIQDRPISARSPCSVAERLIGSIRRECLDHVIVFSERHLRHLLSSYEQYYNELRTHLSLKKDAPIPRDVQRAGRVLPSGQSWVDYITDMSAFEFPTIAPAIAHQINPQGSTIGSTIDRFADWRQRILSFRQAEPFAKRPIVGNAD
jgi:hypothetical protein